MNYVRQQGGRGGVLQNRRTFAIRVHIHDSIHNRQKQQMTLGMRVSPPLMNLMWDHKFVLLYCSRDLLVPTLFSVQQLVKTTEKKTGPARKIHFSFLGGGKSLIWYNCHHPQKNCSHLNQIFLTVYNVLYSKKNSTARWPITLNASMGNRVNFIISNIQDLKHIFVLLPECINLRIRLSDLSVRYLRVSHFFARSFAKLNKIVLLRRYKALSQKCCNFIR